jgi:Flp pilus assembly protein TadG
MRKCHFSQITAKTAGRLRDARGQALVEFAVVLPVLILIILGIIYFGRYEDYSSQETQLAGQAARDAAIAPASLSTGAAIDAYIVAQAPGELQSATGNVTSAVAVYIYYPSGPACGAAIPATCVRACVTAQVTLPFVGWTKYITQTATAEVQTKLTSTGTAPPATCPQS